jgi:hypothetical protein
MTANRSHSSQDAIDFLLGLEAGAVDVSSLPASADYGALVRLAMLNGVETDEAALQNGFALIMQARVIAQQRFFPVRDMQGDRR